MNTFKNEFSWSKTRDDLFNKCHRMYYYRYYGSWNGWLDEADERTRKIYILKQLQTKQMWAGKKVHETIHNILEDIQSGKKSTDAQKAIDETLAIMRKDFKNSKQGNYWKKPKTCALFEHEYEIQLPNSEWKNTANHVIECLNNFFNSDVFDVICNLADEQWLEVEKLSSFMYSDVKIFVSPDFAFKDCEKISIYDWKTGKFDDDLHKLQPSCYCLYAVNTWRMKPEDIEMTEFYLSNKELKEYKFSDSKLDIVTQYIQDSAKKMIELLDNKETNITKEERFSFAKDERVCDYCNYRKLCSRWE